MKVGLEHEGRLVFGTHDGFETSGTGVLTHISKEFEKVLDSVRTTRVSRDSWFFYSIPFVHKRSTYRLYAFAAYAQDKLKRDGYWGAGAAFLGTEETELRTDSLFDLEEWAFKKISQLRQDPTTRHDQMQASNAKSDTLASTISTPELFHIPNYNNMNRERFFNFTLLSNISPSLNAAERGFIVSSSPLPGSYSLDDEFMSSIISEIDGISTEIQPRVNALKNQFNDRLIFFENRSRTLIQEVENALYRDYQEQVSMYRQSIDETFIAFRHSSIGRLQDEILKLERAVDYAKGGRGHPRKLIKRISTLEKQLRLLEGKQNHFLADLEDRLIGSMTSDTADKKLDKNSKNHAINSLAQSRRGKDLNIEPFERNIRSTEGSMRMIIFLIWFVILIIFVFYIGLL